MQKSLAFVLLHFGNIRLDANHEQSPTCEAFTECNAALPPERNSPAGRRILPKPEFGLDPAAISVVEAVLGKGLLQHLESGRSFSESVQRIGVLDLYDG